MKADPHERPPDRGTLTLAARVALIYMLAATAWIVLSDFVASWTIDSFGGLGINVAKGLGFVLVTSCLLYAVLHREESRQERMRRDLAESQARYRSLFTASGVPFFVIDGETFDILNTNDAACRRYGWSLEEFRAMKLQDLVAMSPQEIRKRWDEILSGKTTQLFSRHRLKEGGTIEVEVFTGPIRRDGKTVIFSIVTDITKRREAERERDEERALLTAMVEESPDGILVTNPKGLWRLWNDRMLELWDLDDDYARMRTTTPATEEILQPVLEGLENPDSFLKNVIYAYENPEGVFRDTLRRKNGRVLEALGAPIMLGDRYCGRAWYYHDITDRVKLEESLRQSLEQLNNIVDSSPLAMMTLDSEGRILSWSQGSERLFGWSEQEIVGNPVPIVPEDREEEFRGYLGRVLKGETLRGVRIVRQTKAGERIALSLNAAPLRDSRGIPHGVLAVLEDLSAREQAEKRLMEMATFDPLTGLLNRVSFQDRLLGILAESSREASIAALFYLDIDNFKVINDSLGHDAGDQLLRQFASRVSRIMRKGDLIGRLGGDEFGILQLNLKDPADASYLADRILYALREPFVIEAQEHRASVSIGVAYYPRDGTTAESLLKSADLAMYEAKRRGRQTWASFTEELGKGVRQRQELEVALHHAIEREEFSIHFQPLVQLSTGRISGLEALLRWDHPERGFIPPDVFIPVAETTGLIRPIGYWVLREVCRLASVSDGIRRKGLRISVNLSFAQFNEADFVERVRDITKQSGVRPDVLELELTETMLAADARRAKDVIRGLSDLGVQIAIDDFGTGYSSLAHLRQFQVDRLKIDRSFVMDMPESTGSAAIVRASVGLAHSLGLNVIAEGVETEQQAEILRGLNCDEAQGYFFGRPAPFEELGIDD